MLLSRIRLGITIALIIALGSLTWLYRAEIKQSAELAQTVLQQRADLGQMESELKRSQELRKKAESIAQKNKTELEKINKETRRLKNEIQDLERNNKEVQVWSDSDIPDPVLNVLRNKDKNNNKD